MPDGLTVNLERVSHMITELFIQMVEILLVKRIMNTPYGKIVKGLIDEGVN